MRVDPSAYECRAIGQSRRALWAVLFVWDAWVDDRVCDESAGGLNAKAELKRAAAHGFCGDDEVAFVEILP